jgi:hypothetical protein
MNQFFLNGGTNAYVVGLRASYRDTNEAYMGEILPATLTLSDVTGSIVFTALEPTDPDHPITVTVSNLRTSDPAPQSPPQSPLHLPDTIADITITYGSLVETYRKVSLDPNDPNFIEKRIGTGDPLKPQISTLVTVAVSPESPPSGTAFTVAGEYSLQYASQVGPHYDIVGE